MPLKSCLLISGPAVRFHPQTKTLEGRYTRQDLAVEVKCSSTQQV